MTTIKSLHEDLLYTILSKCSSSIDMWHLLLALDYDLIRMVNLRAFWSHVRLSSLYNKNILFSFTKEIAVYCVDLRIDNLNWMIVADLRRLLKHFHSLVCFHSGNVSLSKSILINDLHMFFPFLKCLTLLILFDDVKKNLFQEICGALNQIKQLEYLSLVLQEKKGGYLSDRDARIYFRLTCEYISNITNEYKLISIEENGYEIKNRFLSIDIPEETSFGTIDLSLISTLKHLIISFRSMLNVNLILKIIDSQKKKLELQTLVLPCIPLTLKSIDILDLNHLQILDIGYINVKNPIELTRLDDILLSYRQHSLRNLTISLSEWQSARLVVIGKKEDNRSTTSSVFEDCFEEILIPEEKTDQSIDEFSLEFLDNTQLPIFQFSLHYSWLNKLTNLNLTGIHCHSIDLKHIFNSLYLLRSLSISPCLLFYIDQFECHCQTISTSYPYQIHLLNKKLLSLNLVLHVSNPKELCSIFLEQYKLHCIRHSSIHQYLNNNNHFFFQYEYFIRYSIQTIFQTLDLHHLSIRIPNYEFHIDDFDIQNSNHLQSLILDVKLPVTFHIKLARLYAENSLNYLRRFLLISDNNFEITPLLIDRFRTLEIIEILSINYHLTRPTIIYLEKVLKPNNYPNLNTFRLWIGSVDAKHLLKHLHRTIRLAYEKIKPAFQFDISIINPSVRLNQIHKCIFYDYTHEIHQDFHSLLSIHSNQLSIIYPNFLNFKPLYSEQKFDK